MEQASSILNRLLAGLPADEFAQLPLERVTLAVGQTLAPAGAPYEYVYFPERALVSIVAWLEDGVGVEVGVVGSEGMVGLPVALGAERAPPVATFVQIAGGGWRMKASQVASEMERSSLFRQRLLRFAQAHYVQVSQTAACNARHPLNERLSRWLLMAREATQRDELPLTHDFLGMMLGVRRPGVTMAVGALQQAGVIERAPGRITILDPEKLEAAACGCFAVVQEEYRRLLG